MDDDSNPRHWSTLVSSGRDGGRSVDLTCWSAPALSLSVCVGLSAAGEDTITIQNNLLIVSNQCLSAGRRGTSWNPTSDSSSHLATIQNTEWNVSYVQLEMSGVVYLHHPRRLYLWWRSCRTPRLHKHCHILFMPWRRRRSSDSLHM